MSKFIVYVLGGFCLWLIADSAPEGMFWWLFAANIAGFIEASVLGKIED